MDFRKIWKNLGKRINPNHDRKEKTADIGGIYKGILGREK